MAKNINSNYILKIIISNVNEKRKLNLFKYNKALQKQIDIRLINYKLLSRSYIIFEKNGRGKEYSFYLKRMEEERNIVSLTICYDLKEVI